MKKVDRFFKDKHGKWAVIEWPNILLWAWIILTVGTWLIHDNHLKILQSCVLFAWAYLEVTDGNSYFRRMLGAVVLIAVVYGAITA